MQQHFPFAPEHQVKVICCAQQEGIDHKEILGHHAKIDGYTDQKIFGHRRPAKRLCHQQRKQDRQQGHEHIHAHHRHIRDHFTVERIQCTDEQCFFQSANSSMPSAYSAASVPPSSTKFIPRPVHFVKLPGNNEHTVCSKSRTAADERPVSGYSRPTHSRTVCFPAGQHNSETRSA